MKRHQALVSLSRDHHEGLLLAVRLQQGKKALLRLWSHDPFWQADYVVKFYQEHLAPHFEAEENVLFPLAMRYLKENSAMVEQLVKDHETMKEFVEFFRHPEEKKLECNIEQFGALLELHIRREEREFFPLCEEFIPQEKLLTAQTAMERSDQKGDKS